MKHLLLATAAVFLPLAASAQIMGTSVSTTLTAGTVKMVEPQQSQIPAAFRFFERIANVGAAGVAWCSRFDQNPAPNKAGSFPLAPYGNPLGYPSFEEYTGAPNGSAAHVPQEALYCTADTGSATITGETVP